ncbi:hypothetical protein ACFRCR_07610 [Oerskovia sp. NPDC056781]|uniref:hypothetical protein n=1 Tax=Oerskovia sp. NPDC056781 TaxID=3345942 RepID=UPI00366B70A9
MTIKAVISTTALVLVLGGVASGCSTGGQSPEGAGTSSPTTAEPSPTPTDDPVSPGPGPSSPAPPAPSTPSPSPTSAPAPSTSPGPAKPTVGSIDVMISNSTWDPAAGVVVRGFADTVDTEATCTLELSLSGVVRTVTSEALEGPTTMSCGELIVSSAEVSPGDWTAVLSYESTTAWGASAPVVVTVS